MPTINMTREAHYALQQNAEGRFVNTSVVMPDGTLDVVVSEDVYARLIERQFDCETISDTIIRICAMHKSAPN